MKKNNDLWNISNRPSTKIKLEILEKVFDIWLTIWNKQNWISNEWYVLDLFAGPGKYFDKNETVNGSPLIFLKKISDKINKLRSDITIRLFFVEIDSKTFKELNKNVKNFIENSRSIMKIVDVKLINGDCNNVIKDILSEIPNDKNHPLFIFIDPTGLQIKKNTIMEIVNLQNSKDIIFNYILEGVRRTSGVAKKIQYKKTVNIKEIKTAQTLQKFIGENVDVLNKSDIEILEQYCSIFTSNKLKVVAYDVKYPNRNDTLYYLLFAVKNTNVADIVKGIYAKQKEKEFGKTLFGGRDFYINAILTMEPNIIEINRKTLLYRTKVEYGNWTINHIIGCKHGCKFPCYAMIMAKRFGWIKDYEDWRRPRIAKNALELLEKEIPKYKDQIDFVHLCFMSDPFMYDFEKKQSIPEIKDLTLKIIEKLNSEGIKVTTLTKGIYPEDILDKKKFLQNNEYGITLVSLNDKFKEKFEPFSAPYKERIDSLKKLSQAGLNTWVSMEPYPTPKLDETAENIEKILESIGFVQKIIFGKLNYNRLMSYGSNSASVWKNNEEFYKEMAMKVINFCKKNNIKYHIKSGTPLSKTNTINIFKE